MRQSTVSGAVEAGQPAADRENVDGGPTQEMVASELEQPARHLQGWIHHRQTRCAPRQSRRHAIPQAKFLLGIVLLE